MMKAMILTNPHNPLELKEVAIPEPGEGQVLLKVETCGVCRTDLHVFDGELPHPKLPLILGHQVVGTVLKNGNGSNRFSVGDRVGAPWLAKSCNHCPYCIAGQENLCDHGLYMGYQINGGFAEYCTAYEDYIFPIPKDYSSLHAAPLLCAGLIGYRTLRIAGEGKRLGFYGFGVAAHILIQIACFQNREVFAFTREGDTEGQKFAKSLGASWAGSSKEMPPKELDAALIFAPVGDLIPSALKAVKKGGSVVCAGIYMTDIPSFPYSLLYGERVLRSVTNLTREDGIQFFNILEKAKIETVINPYPLEQANEALNDFREGKLTGSAVLSIS